MTVLNFLKSILIAGVFLLVLSGPARLSAQTSPLERTLAWAEITEQPVSFSADIGASGEFTWWLPAGADEYILPLAAGVAVDPQRADLMHWLRQGSPWPLTELPVVALRDGERTLVVIVPWPHYASLIVTNRMGIRFSFPRDRHQATPCEIVALRRGAAPLEAARAFREWRRTATNTGAIPRPRPLRNKIAGLSPVSRLLGAPHFYLWGPALFCRHDVPATQWTAFARALRDAPTNHFGSALTQQFTADERRALHELAAAPRALNYLTTPVAGAINRALSERDLLNFNAGLPAAEVIQRNQQALAAAFEDFVQPPESWGDGLSMSLLNSLHEAGIDRALLVLSDLCSRQLRPDAVARAAQLGYLLGPYDSYHSVHSPMANPASTWETAQFDTAAYEQGRIINAAGTGSPGFKQRGYHFSPQAAWPWVQRRVTSILRQVPYSAWFVDCDATAEGFDDYSPAHPATRVDDGWERRHRLAWLETAHRLVVGSEGGSVLFADVIHFGHGIQTPYLGHLDPAMSDPQSPHFPGRYWPPDGPDHFFRTVPPPPALKVPYFDPTVRIPFYQAALHDELVTTHHWSFDSLKFSEVETIRELLDILYVVPPLYHLNRATWPQRRDRILKHLAFWGPLHRALATAPLTEFAYLSPDRRVQRTTFLTPNGEVTITVNFSRETHVHGPPYSATVRGALTLPQSVYRATPKVG
jgi:hypothetical protein